MVTQQIDEEAIFDVARRIESSELRADYLLQVCGDNASVLSCIKALLKVHDKKPEFLESSISPVDPTIDLPPITEKVGSVIALYKLMEQIGEGGMGIVYVAEQKKPVRRKVALKIIKPGMDTRHAFFYDDDLGMIDLNLAVADVPIECFGILRPTMINDFGDICGSTDYSTGLPQRAFLLKPRL